MSYGATFESAVDRHFLFLIEAGFVRSPAQSIGAEWCINFENSLGVEIHVQYEMGAGCWVTLLAPKGQKIAGGRRFALHELLQECEREGTFQPRVRDETTIEARVAGLAEDLRATGSPVFAGDFSLLFAKRARLVAAVAESRRNSAFKG